MWSHNTQIPAGRTRIGPVLPEDQDRDRRHGIYSFLMFSVFLVYIFYCSLDYYVGFNRADLYAGLHTHMFNSPVSQYQKGKTNLDFTEAKDSEWQWH